MTRLLSIFPWVLSAFLLGVLVMGWRGETKVEQQYEERLKEAALRLEVAEGALTVVENNKFRVHDAKRAVIWQMNREGKR